MLNSWLNFVSVIIALLRSLYITYIALMFKLHSILLTLWYDQKKWGREKVDCEKFITCLYPFCYRWPLYSVHSSTVSSSSYISLSDESMCHLQSCMTLWTGRPDGKRTAANFEDDALVGINDSVPVRLSKHKQHQVSHRM
jgi:hypothetical protein